MLNPLWLLFSIVVWLMLTTLINLIEIKPTAILIERVKKKNNIHCILIYFSLFF